ncbi:MAG TPA: LysR family transcriptional regulator [Bordetella sp.]
MKLEAFQTLAAVVGKGSFAAAAQAMHMTPSAVSMQMKQLEQYLGKPLFDRSGQQVRMRPAALALVETMAPALNALSAMRRRTATEIEGHLQVGVIEGLQPLLLPPAIRYLRDHYPRLEVSPQRGTSLALTEEVKAGRLDAAIAAKPPRGTQAGLRWIPLAQQGLVFILPPAGSGAAPHAPRRLGEAELKRRIRTTDWIRYDRATTTGSLATRFVHKLVPGKRSLMELGSAAAIAAMVNAGLGFSVLQLIDAGLVRQYPLEVFQLPRNGPVFELCVVMRASDADDRLLQAWLEAVRHAMPGDGAAPSA